MGEEMTQSEMVRRSQLAIAKGMKINSDAIKIIEDIKDWAAREWLYICALDGMDLKKLTDSSMKMTLSQVKKKREEYLRGKYGDTAELRAANNKMHMELEKLQSEVKETCDESREVRAAVLKLLKNQQRPSESEFQRMGMLLKEKEKEIENLKEQIAELTIQNDDRVSRNKTKKNSETVKIPWSLAKFHKKSFNTKKFIKNYLQDERFTKEQLEYLLQCMEEGMSISEIDAFAIPGIPVETMKRIKNLQVAGGKK